ncbi:DUF3304 domain-containing protein [Xylophilus sp. GOD-11R]|uniref:DUF3304 domain-containing protein n=1 Tax=Xylophilus sp. GOD-11R TaxID=3089814 RepID=UPI00298BDA72|nr:DUF3304 domain-containing protein [Xylophilus sp. GOD-11R]WPB55568.1 DUF3304 domain-containing protein [Xylophilus sp. GOD-11R]
MSLLGALTACASPPPEKTPEQAEYARYLQARQAKRAAEKVPTFPVSISCYGHGAGYIYSFSVQEPVYGQFSRRMIWGGSGNCGLVLAGYQVPLTWTPGMKVKVRWKPDGREWIEKTTAILPYDKPGTVIVHFFPHDEVRVVVSNFYPEGPNHPILPTATVPPPEPD